MKRKYLIARALAGIHRIDDLSGSLFYELTTARQRSGFRVRNYSDWERALKFTGPKSWVPIIIIFRPSLGKARYHGDGWTYPHVNGQHTCGRHTYGACYDEIVVAGKPTHVIWMRKSKIPQWVVAMCKKHRIKLLRKENIKTIL